MTAPMTPEQFAEIKARHADDARTYSNTGQVSNGFADRAALLAEVASALVALQSAPRPQPGSAGYRRWCQWYDGARAESLK